MVHCFVSISRNAGGERADVANPVLDISDPLIPSKVCYLAINNLHANQEINLHNREWVSRLLA